MIHLIICDFITIFILFCYGKIFFNFRYKNTFLKYILLSFFSIILLLINHNGMVPFKAFFVFTLYITFIFLFFKNKLLNLLTIGCSFYIIVSLSEILTSIMISYILSTTNLAHINSFAFTICLYSSTILSTIIVYLISMLKRHIKLETKKSFPLAIVLPTITVILILTTKNYFTLLSNNLIALVIIYSLCLINLVTGIIFMLIISNNNAKHALKQSEYHNKLVNMRYELLNKSYNNNFNHLHDLLHICLSLKESIKEKNYIELDNKLNDLIDQTYINFNAIYSNSIILNCIINNDITRINKNNIHINTYIYEEDLNNLDINIQFELFNYLLDLAIINNTDPHINNDYKMIAFRTKKIGQQIILKIEYTFYKTNKRLDEKIIFDLKNIFLKNHITISISILEENPHIKSIIIRWLSSNKT